MTTDPAFQKRNKSRQINYLGLLRPHAWGSNAVKKGAMAKWTASLWLNTSVYLSVSAPVTIHMEQVNSPGSMLSLMQSRLLLTLGHAQRGRWQNPHLHHSPPACPPVLRPMRRCSQCTPLRCHQCTSLYHQSHIHNPHMPSNTLIHSQPIHFTQHPCFHLTHSLLP